MQLIQKIMPIIHYFGQLFLNFGLFWQNPFGHTACVANKYNTLLIVLTKQFPSKPDWEVEY